MNGQVFNCSATCELMYSTRQTCELTSAGYCSWDPTTNLCTRACNGISSQGTCAAASTCDWNYVSQSCVIQCNFVADCTTRPDCVTDPDTGICKVACSGRASLTDCNSDSDCTWSAKSVTCETRCESILNSTQCVNSGTCVWNGPTSSCMRHCSLIYSTEATCDADSRCAWDESSGLCSTACDRITVNPNSTISQALCTSQSMCQYDSVSKACETRCLFRTTTSQGCNTFDDCEWNNDASQCNTKCSSITDMTVCEFAAMCQPNAAGTTCIEKCRYRYTDSTACAADPQCSYNALSSTPGCYNDCLYSNATACAADTQCKVLPSGGCARGCSGSTTSLTCSNAVGCQWDATNGQCVTGCAEIQAQVQCEGDEGLVPVEFHGPVLHACMRCLVQRVNRVYHSRCPKLPVEPLHKLLPHRLLTGPHISTMRGPKRLPILQRHRNVRDRMQHLHHQLHLLGRWKVPMEPAQQHLHHWFFFYVDGSCSTKCSYLGKNSAACAAAPSSVCSMTTDGVCGANCGAVTNMNTCSEISICRASASNTTCVNGCAALYNLTVSCNADSGCRWDGALGVCAPNCDLISDTTTCTSDASCMLSATGDCAASCGTRFKNSSICSTSSDCMWDATNGFCATNCTLITSSASCYTTPMCTYMPQLSSCQVQCQYTPISSCGGYMCVNRNGTCTPQCPFKYAVSGSCNADPYCEWQAGAATCGPRLCLTTSQTQCLADGVCNWNATTGVCTRKPCTWTDQYTCQTDNACEWWLSNLTCIPRLCNYSATNPTSCQASETCAFAHGACQKTCPNIGTSAECLESNIPCMWSADGFCRNTCENSSLIDGHVVITLCQLDSKDCIYTTATQDCIPTCSRRQTVGACTSTVDGANSVCSWRNSSCRISCSVNYQQTGSCSSDCQSVDGGCIEPCNLHPDTTTCSATTDCIWNYATSSCAVKCNLAYQSSTTCNSDSRCTWNFAGTPQSCAQSCSIYAQAQCTFASHSECSWDAVTKACVTNCTSRHNDITSCMADNDCVWADGRCINGCGMQGTSSTCTAVTDSTNTALCMMAIVGAQQCVRVCSLLYPTLGNISDCTSNPNCDWNYLSGQCGINHCTATNPETCGADSANGISCNWNIATSTCSKPCQMLYSATDCTGRVDCMLDPSDIAAGNTDVTCVPKCSTYSVASCGTMPDSTACTTYDQLAPSCVISCTLLLTEYQCYTSSGSVCEWYNGQCVPLCQYAFSSTTISGISQCESATPRCTFSNGVCRDAECYATGMESCNNRTVCQWNTNASTCGPAPCQYDTQEACVQIAPNVCEWAIVNDAPACREIACPTGLTAAQCAAKAGCQYSTATSSCEQQACYFQTMESCVRNGCFWNVTDGQCSELNVDCEYTDYSAFSDCSMPCGGGLQYATRFIIRPALPGGVACDINSLTISQFCNVNVTCDCATITDPDQCGLVAACSFVNGFCSTTNVGCMSTTDVASCGNTTGCQWNSEVDVCQAAAIPQGCSGVTQQLCATRPTTCIWNNISSAIATYTPGGSPIYPLSTMVISTSATILDGIVVVIDIGFAAYSDYLSVNDSILASGMIVSYSASAGVLRVEGLATISEYQNVIRGVAFTTTSPNTATRTISWAAGRRVYFSSATGHAYRFLKENLTFSGAEAGCAASAINSIEPGYLASIGSAAENNFLAYKMLVDGWIGGSDADSPDQWSWVAGPQTGTSFWTGRSAVSGGVPVNNAFTNWDTTGVVPLPDGNGNTNYLRISPSGLWSDTVGTLSLGSICEFGGSSPLINGLTGVTGYATVRFQGCVPIDTGCSTLTAAQCSVNPACAVSETGTCKTSCLSYGPDTCSQHSGCILNTSTLPNTCSEDTCASKSQAQCTGSCQFANGVCAPLTGCPQWLTSASCSLQSECMWNSATSSCSKASCTRYMPTGSSTCNASSTCMTSCIADPACDYLESSDVCVDRLCIQENSCTTNPTVCSVVTAQAGASAYTGTPLNIVNFANVKSGETGARGVVVQITRNFVVGDVLRTTKYAAYATYNAEVGVLTIYGENFDWVDVVTDVQFSTTTSNTAVRTIDWNLLDAANPVDVYYVSAAKRFFGFLPSGGIAYVDALTACVSLKSWTRAGTLAVVDSSPVEAGLINLIATPSMFSINGWIAGIGLPIYKGVNFIYNSSNTAPTQFFTGSSYAGVFPGYSHWASNEPSGLPLIAGSLAHVLLYPTGEWYSVVDSTSATGAYCQYPGTTSDLRAGTVYVQPTGCFAMQCKHTTQESCAADTQCYWASGQCAVNDCAGFTNSSACNAQPLCYFQYSSATCVLTPKLGDCTTNSTGQCSSGCTSSPQAGGCVHSSCSKFPDTVSCTYSQNCQWEDTLNKCVSRMCSPSHADTYFCQSINGVVSVRSCFTLSASQCSANSNCVYNSGFVPSCQPASTCAIAATDPATIEG
ncbi:Hypothetical protein, putative, partial [Bodo saltans]